MQHLHKILSLTSMTTSGKIALGVVASGALVAAWLLTGSRKEKTRDFVSKKSENLKTILKPEKSVSDDQDFYYI